MSTLNQPPLIVITGASAGIGAALAKKFGAGNFRIALLARRIDQLEELKREIKAQVYPYQIDITDKDAVFQTIDHIEKTIGPIDLLINNAGLALGMDPVHKCNVDDWDRCIDVNIKGLIYCTRAVVAGMVRRNRGHIIHIGSISATYAYPGANIYGGTKAFVHQFSLNMRTDLLGTKVRVTCIEPGMVGGTEFSNVRLKGDTEGMKKTYEGVQYLTAADIAETVYFCHSVPEHVNINFLELMPIQQAPGPLAIHRT